METTGRVGLVASLGFREVWSGRGFRTSGSIMVSPSFGEGSAKTAPPGNVDRVGGSGLLRAGGELMPRG